MYIVFVVRVMEIIIIKREGFMIKDLILYYCSGFEYERLWEMSEEEILREFFDNREREGIEEVRKEMIKDIERFEI